MLVDSLNCQVTISDIRSVKECLSLMPVRNDELLHEFDHAVAHLNCNVQATLDITQVVANVLLVLEHFIVYPLSVQGCELILARVFHHQGLSATSVGGRLLGRAITCANLPWTANLLIFCLE